MTHNPYWLSALAGNALYLDLSARRDRRLIDRLAQGTGNRRLAMAQFRRDRAQALAALAQQVDSTAFHAS